ncbi:MAG: rhomboid family intramembrane serine protease [Hyphomicrobiales bacterium]
MQQYRPGRFSILPSAVKNLIIINIIVFLAQIGLEKAFHIDLAEYLGLHYIEASNFKIYQIVTYMFLHGGYAHIFFNMFALWMFGSTIENIWGAKKFLLFYFFAGIGAGITNEIVYYFEIQPYLEAINQVINNPSVYGLNQLVQEGIVRFDGYKEPALMESFNRLRETGSMQSLVSFLSDYKPILMDKFVTIGASGSVFGLLLAFGMMFPNSMIYIYFAIPIRAKYFVIIYGVIELVQGFYANDNVAHFAHLGGMLFGFILLYNWKRKGRLFS